MPGKSYYSILNLQEGASKAEIKKSYRKLVKKYHPDVSKDPNCHEKYIEINEAYEALLEPKPKIKRKPSTTRAQKWENYKEESRKKQPNETHKRQKKLKDFIKVLELDGEEDGFGLMLYSVLLFVFSL